MIHDAKIGPSILLNFRHVRFSAEPKTSCCATDVLKRSTSFIVSRGLSDPSCTVDLIAYLKIPFCIHHILAHHSSIVSEAFEQGRDERILRCSFSIFLFHSTRSFEASFQVILIWPFPEFSSWALVPRILPLPFVSRLKEYISH